MKIVKLSFSKRVFCAFFCALSFGLISQNGFSQTLVWEDNFDELNTDIWKYETGGDGNGNGELQYYTDRSDNSYIENGNLVLEAKREKFGDNEFTSARLNTYGRFEFKYGTLEARIKLPDVANGVWPAFWLMGNNFGRDGWPKCGEWDIMEVGYKSAIDDGTVNSSVSGAMHWWHESGDWSDWLQADASATTQIAGTFYDDYHIFRLVWDAEHVEISVDGDTYFNMDITDPNMSEFVDNPAFIILNLAVGGTNFVQISNPDDITAPFPAKMLVDWIRIYDNGSTELIKAEDRVETGTYGVYTETTPVDGGITLGTDSELFYWNNMTPNTNTSAQEGSDLLSLSVNAGNWYGMGIACDDKNMIRFNDGELHFHVKTTTTETIGVGISSSGSGDGWIDIANGDTKYGLIRDGQWHEVIIPLNRFGSIDFYNIKQIFMLKGEAPSSNFDIAIDNIYWTESAKRITPENGNFGIYTETTSVVDQFNLGTNGDFYIWANTLNPVSQNPIEGSNSLSFESTAGLTWFGASFTPEYKYNLSAFRYANSKLHFAMKSSSNTTFKIGMKSGNLEGIGEVWKTFQAGNDPYGFARDGQWHIIEIPMSDFTDVVDLREVSQLFQILGVDGAISDLEFDDIYFTGGGTALADNDWDDANTAPIAIAGDDQTIQLPANTSSLNGSASYDPDGDAITYAWTKVSGPDVTINNANSAIASISNLLEGTYVFELSVNDGSFSHADQLTVTVLPAIVVEDNLALNKTATSSSIEGAQVPANAVDGDLGTRSSTEFSVPQWLKVDLGQSYEIAKVVLNWERACAESYYIMISNVDSDPNPSSADWTIISSQTGMADAARIDELNGLAGCGQYIAMYATNKLHPWGISLYEFEVYGTTCGAPINTPPVADAGSDITIELPVNYTSLNGSASYDDDNDPLSYQWVLINGGSATIISSTASISDVQDLSAGTYTFQLTVDDGTDSDVDEVTITVLPEPITGNLALNKSVVSSSVENAGTAIENINDGNTGTRWSSEWSDPQWVKIDLEASYTISNVVLNWERACAESYYLLISETDGTPDPATWTVLADQTGMADQARIDDLTGLSGSGRYIAMYGYNRLHPWGYSIFEFEVYGSLSLKSANDIEENPNAMYEVMNIYPNPVVNELNIESNGEIQKITVYDIAGNLKVSNPIETKEGKVSMDINFLAPGVYFIKIEGESFAQTQRFIKQ